jgi:hypothetical protein
VRPACGTRPRAERQRLQHVRATTHSAIENHFDAIAHGIDDFLQHLERRIGDKNGRIRAKFGLAPEASPTMGMQVADGELSQVYSLAEQGSPTLGLYDHAGKVRVRLGLAAEGSPVLRLLDRDGELRAIVGLAGDGSPFVQFLDEVKQPTWTMR